MAGEVYEIKCIKAGIYKVNHAVKHSFEKVSGCMKSHKRADSIMHLMVIQLVLSDHIHILSKQ